MDAATGAVSFFRYQLEGLVSGPVAVAALDSRIVVSELTSVTVCLYDTASSRPVLVWRVGAAGTALSVPLGLRFSQGGTHVLVADYRCVCAQQGCVCVCVYVCVCV